MVFISCQKNIEEIKIDSSKIDLSKLTDVEWVSDKENYPFWIYKFNKDSTGYQKHIANTWYGTYFTNYCTWSVTKGDTLRIVFPQFGSYTETIRIFSITDSTFIMNDFNLNTGAAVPDTVVFYRR